MIKNIRSEERMFYLIYSTRLIARIMPFSS